MDSDLRNTPGTRFRLWPGLWMPGGVILGIGILVSVALANTLARTIADLGLEAYHARHQALVATIAARLQHTPGAAIACIADLSFGDRSARGPAASNRYSRQTHQTGCAGARQRRRAPPGFRGPAYRADTARQALDGHHHAQRRVDRPGSNQARWQILTAGAGISVLAALLMLVACRRLAIRNARIRQQQAQLDRDQQQITNLRVEKSVLRHALNDSEARSRDLVRLGGAVIAELDHQGASGLCPPRLPTCSVARPPT